MLDPLINSVRPVIPIHGFQLDGQDTQLDEEFLQLNGSAVQLAGHLSSFMKSPTGRMQ